MTAVDLIAYFAHLSLDENMTEEEKSARRLTLDKETVRLKKKFDSLVLDLQRSIEKSQTIKDVMCILQFYYPKLEAELSDCKTIREVFNQASKYWSFFDYDIVKQLSEKLGTAADKQKLNHFRVDFKEYSKRRICECPVDAFGKEVRPGQNYVLKVDKSMERCTVDEIKTLRKKMNRVLGKKLVRLIHVNEDNGSVELTFRPFADDVFDISIKQQQDLRGIGVCNIRKGDQCIDLDVDPEEVGTSGELYHDCARGKVIVMVPICIYSVSEWADSQIMITHS